MFDEVAPTYDLTNDLLSLGMTRRWRGLVAKAVDPRSGQTILDLAAGTGSSSIAFAKPGVNVIATDFSEGMLAEGRKLGRLLRPKADGRSASFYTLIARDTVDQDFAQNRQRFLAEQGYSYEILDAHAL